MRAQVSHEMRPMMLSLRAKATSSPALAAVTIGAADALRPADVELTGLMIVRVTHRPEADLVVYAVLGLTCWLVGALACAGLLS